MNAQRMSERTPKIMISIEIRFLSESPLTMRHVDSCGGVALCCTAIVVFDGAAPAGVTVREVAGGCVCCASAPYLGVALHFLLVDAQPDRLLIETTGLGHPAKLIDTLRAGYRDRLDVRATLGLVDPADFARPEMRANPIFREQVEIADVLVLNKLDAAAPELVADFQAWATGLYPPKLLIAATTRGRLDPTWLDLGPGDEETLGRSDKTGQLSSPGHPVTRSPGLFAKGWTFPPAVVFDRDRLVALLTGFPGLVRVKGVFRTRHDWLALNGRGGDVAVSPTAYRRDSRVEAFADAPDWGAFEQQLHAARNT